MMIEAPTAIAVPAAGEFAQESGAVRRSGLVADLRFFLLCYLAGLIVFLVMLS